MPERSKWQMVAWAVAAVLLVLGAARLLGTGAGGAPDPPPVRVGGGASGAAASGGGAAGGRGGLYVHVAGEVRRPGLVRVPEGARVAAAVARAGGPARRADLTVVNLAQRLEDGQQVIVPRVGAGGAVADGGAAPSTGATGGAAGSGGVPLSLATATVEQLEQLDGIGPTLAERILAFRDEHGGFRSVDQLQEVEGIGEKRFAALKEAVRP